jgi:hypothetical protein
MGWVIPLRVWLTSGAGPVVAKPLFDPNSAYPASPVPPPSFHSARFAPD